MRASGHRQKYRPFYYVQLLCTRITFADYNNLSCGTTFREFTCIPNFVGITHSCDILRPTFLRVRIPYEIIPINHSSTLFIYYQVLFRQDRSRKSCDLQIVSFPFSQPDNLP